MRGGLSPQSARRAIGWEPLQADADMARSTMNGRADLSDHDSVMAISWRYELLELLDLIMFTSQTFSYRIPHHNSSAELSNHNELTAWLM
jgi:hypothetical protein